MEENQSPPKNVTFHYIKSNFFRVVHVDGAIGGITPTGDIFCSVYSQRGAIPQITVQTLLDSGELGDEIVEQRVTKMDIVREVEVGMTLSVPVAEALINWLRDKVEIAQRIRPGAPKTDGSI